MAQFPISSGKEKQLIERMHALGVREQDIDEQFVRSSGAGGQNVNKVSSCVVVNIGPRGFASSARKSAPRGSIVSWLEDFYWTRSRRKSPEPPVKKRRGSARSAARKESAHAAPSFAYSRISDIKARKNPGAPPSGRIIPTSDL